MVSFDEELVRDVAGHPLAAAAAGPFLEKCGARRRLAHNFLQRAIALLEREVFVSHGLFPWNAWPRDVVARLPFPRVGAIKEQRQRSRHPRFRPGIRYAAV